MFIGSDLGAGTLAEAMKRFPSRVLMEGIAEQHIVGMAAGLALEGFIPFVHTIGTFLTRRAFEQVAIDVALHQLPVRLIASGGGMVYAPLGPTHQAVEDFALMGAIPGMAIFSPADPFEMKQVVRSLTDYQGPAYVRLGKGGEPHVTGESFEVGELKALRTGTDALIISTGAVVHECLDAADGLAALGIKASVLHVPTISPLDEDALTTLISKHSVVLVVEEHIPSGGLWTRVVELLNRRDLPRVIHQASLPNRYAESYGSQRDHWQAANLTSEAITERIAQLTKDSNRG